MSAVVTTPMPDYERIVAATVLEVARRELGAAVDEAHDAEEGLVVAIRRAQAARERLETATDVLELATRACARVAA